MIDLPEPLRRRLSRRLVRAARDPRDRADQMTIGALLDSLGERSFGWCLLIFSLLNLLPVPVGTNMITSIPLIVLTAQMALGYDQVRLPGFIARRGIGRRRFQKLVLWLGPLIRPVERIVRPRLPFILAPRAERLLGGFLFVVAVALFVPLPLISYLPAAALCLAGIGLVERDGLVTLAAVALGVVAVIAVLAAGAALIAGVDADRALTSAWRRRCIDGVLPPCAAPPMPLASPPGAL